MNTKTQKFMRVFLVAISAICFAAGIAFMGNVSKPVALADEVEESDFGETTYNVSKTGEHMLLVTPLLTDITDVYEVGYVFTGDNIPDVAESEKCATNKYYTSVKFGKGDPMTAADIFRNEDYDDDTPMIIWEVPRDATKVYTYKAYYKKGTRIDDVLYAKDSDKPQYNDEKVTPLFFTVTIDEDGGSEVSDLSVPDGTKASYLNKISITKTGYHYNGWEYYDGEGWEDLDLENDTVTEDVTVRPAWEINTYTITWKNYDGTVIGTDTVNYGATPAYSGDTPTKAADAQYTYTYNGWSPAITAATADAEYTATYGSTLNSYTITWSNYDGTTIDTDTVNYGETPAYSGETPTRAADAQYTYTFSAWSPAVSSVTGNATYTATYSTTTNEYTVTWVNEGVTIETDLNVPYGTTPSFDGEDPEKEGKTFLGWEDENGDRIADDATVTGDMTLTAVWGIGTPTTLYVANKADFLAMGRGYDAKEYRFITYHLTADLSFDYSDFTYNSSTDPDFMGLDGMPKTGYLVRDLNFVFDGQGHTITTNYDKDDDWAATKVTSGYTVIFREIGKNGILRNLKVVATTDSGWGESSVTRWNRGLIDNCYISASHTYQYGWSAGECFCNTAEIIYNYGTVSNCVFNLYAEYTGNGLQGTTNYAVRYTEDGSVENCVIIGNVSSQNMSSNNSAWGTAVNSDDNRDDCYVFASIDNMMLSGVGGKYNTNGTITAGTYTEVKGLFNNACWTAWGFCKFRYAAASVTLDVKNDGENDYGSVSTYNEYAASTNDLSVFTFVSSNTSVATVSSGTITAVGDGTATISVKLGDTVINSISVTVNVWSLVSTSEQFLAMTNGKYVLINDIDFGGAAASIETFSGTLDGNGYAIKNFATKYIFLTNSGTIRNVQFVGSIVGDGTMGAGIIANNRGTVENVFADIDMDIPVSTDGWQSLSAGTIIHSNHDALVRNAVIHVTVKSMSAGSIRYPGAILDEMGTAPYWNSDHINNVYIYLDDAAGITAATPQIYEGGWDAVDNRNTTIHAYSNYSDFVTAVSAAISSGSLPAAFTDFMDQAHRISVVSSAQVIVGNTLNLTSLVTYRLAAVNTTYAIVSGGEYATLDQGVLTGTASGVVRVSVTTPTETKYIDVTVITASFEYDDTSKELVIKTDGVNDYGSVRTYHEYDASTDDLSVFTFESSDTSVATVSSDGEITAVGDGTATISVKYEGNVINSIAVTVNVWNAVSTPEQFLAMTDGKYALVADIDFDGAAASIKTFSGTLDGNGYALKNFESKNLIANNNGIIRNVQIIGSIVGDGTMGAAIIGNNRGTVENVFADIDMDIPAATDGWSAISAGTIIHWSHETGLVKNVVIHVTATQTLAGTFYPGAVLDNMGTSPYWDTNHINNVYIYLDDAAGVTAATPNNGYGSNVAVDILNPTVHAFRNSADFMSYVSAAISSGSLPAAFTDFMAQAHRISVESSAQVIVGNTLDLTSLVTYRLAAVNTTYAIVSGGEYATLSQGVLTGTASGVVRVSVTTPTETKYINVAVKSSIDVYTITWMDDDEIIDTGEFDYGDVIAYDGTLEKEGKTFLGWEDENGDRIADDATVTVTGDMTFTAVWGIGTQTTLYVSSKADFLRMGRGYDAKEYPFITYVLTADLSFDHSDFTYNSSTDPDFMGLDGMPKTGYLVRDLNFVFDGQGHTITTNYQKNDDWAATGVTSGYTVIFREIGTNGILRNLKVVATTDSGWGESSVTRWNRGLINNCYISASHTYQYGWSAGVCFCNTAEIIYNYGTVSNCVFNLYAYHTGEALQGTTNYAVRYSFEGGKVENCVIIGNVSSQNMSSNNGTWGTPDNSDDKRKDCYVFASIDNMLSGVGGKYNTDGTITAGTYTDVKGLFNNAYWTAWGF